MKKKIKEAAPVPLHALTHFAFDTHGAIAIFFEAGVVLEAFSGATPDTPGQRQAWDQITRIYHEAPGTTRADILKLLETVEEEADPLDIEGAIEAFDIVWPVEVESVTDPVGALIECMDFMDDLGDDCRDHTIVTQIGIAHRAVLLDKPYTFKRGAQHG